MGSKLGLGVVKFVPLHLWSASNSAPLRRTAGAKGDTMTFIPICFFCFYLDDGMFSHVVALLKNEADQNLVQNENRLRAHSRDTIGLQRNSRKSGGVSSLWGIFCFVNKLITIYNQFT